MSRQESFAPPNSTAVVVIGDALRPFESGFRADGFTLVSPTDPVRPVVALVSLAHPEALDWCARLRDRTTVWAVADETTDEAGIRLALDAGAEDVVPFSETLLRHRLRRAAAAPPSAGGALPFLEFFRQNPLPCAMFEFDLEGRRYVEVSDAFLAATGFAREELIGFSLDEVGNFARPELLTEMRGLLARKDGPLIFESEFRLKSGRIRKAFVAVKLTEIDGRTFALVVLYDISAIREAEVARAATERRLTELTRVVPGIVCEYRVEADGREAFTFINDSSDRILGLEPATILADPWRVWNLVHPDEAESVRASYVEAHLNLQPMQREFRVRLPDGTEKWLVTTGVPRREGEAVVWSGIFSDVTEVRRLARALEESRQKLEEITAAMPGAVYRYRLNPDGSDAFLFFTGGLDEIFEIPASRILEDARNAWGLVHPADMEQVAATAADSAARLVPWECEYRILTPGGEKWIQGRSRPHREPDGGTAWDGFFTDITERKRIEAERNAAERKLAEITAAMPGAVYQYLKTPGGHYRFTFVSEGAAALFRISSPVVIEEVNRVFNERLTPERLEEAFRLIEESAATMTPYRQEFPVLLPDGSERWLRAESVPRRLDNGGILWSGLMLDISERKQAEAARAAAEAKLREVAAAVPGAVFQYARYPDGGDLFEFVSDGVERIFGVTSAAVLADPATIWNLVHPEDIPPARAEMLRSEQALSGFDIQYRIQDHAHSGEWKWMRVQSVTNRREDGTTVWTGLVTDISDYKFLEASLRASEERFATLFHSNPVASVVTRLRDRGRIAAVNDALTRLFGFTVGDLLGRTTPELGVTVEGPRRTSFYDAVEAGLTPAVTEGVMRLASGEVREFLFASERIVYDGEPCALTMIVDLTDRVQLEEERLRVSKLESLGVMAGGIAHDFNNLLTAMSGNAGLARRYLTTGAPAAKIEDKIESLERAVERAKTLSTQLLTFAKGGDPVRRTVDPIVFVVDPVRFILNPTDVTGRFNAPSGLWQVKADVGQLSQVFQNLAINAVEAMGGTGALEVAIENLHVDASYRLPLDSGRYVRVSVSDTGCGIPFDRLAKIFDPYYTTKPSGSGLGLAVAHSVVMKHGGYIAVKSEVGKGSRFEIYLPARETGALTHEVPVLTAEDEQRLSGRRILVMDDEELVREMTAAMLEDLGYHPSTCPNGESAVARYAAALRDERPFAAVILDLKVMGGMGGLETIHHLRKIDPGVVAIVCSGYFSDPVLARHEVHGFTAKLQKPFKMDELRDLLAGLFGDG